MRHLHTNRLIVLVLIRQFSIIESNPHRSVNHVLLGFLQFQITEPDFEARM